MIHALTELIATHLADSTHGVNALLASVPVVSLTVDASGSGSATATEADDAPSVAAIYHEFRHDWIAQDKDAPAVPSLTVFAATDADLGVSSGDHAPQIEVGVGVTVAVLYLSRHAIGARARREASYTLRAVRGSLVRLATRVSQTNRTLRSVTLAEIDRITEQRLARDVGQGSLAGMVLARCLVVDSLIL